MRPRVHLEGVRVCSCKGVFALDTKDKTSKGASAVVHAFVVRTRPILLTRLSLHLDIATPGGAEDDDFLQIMFV